jgi:hypothetical protein
VYFGAASLRMDNIIPHNELSFPLGWTFLLRSVNLKVFLPSSHSSLPPSLSSSLFSSIRVALKRGFDALTQSHTKKVHPNKHERTITTIHALKQIRKSLCN